MSKLLENKQIIHIATEIVVLIGITFYFSSKNKKLSTHIEDLSQRLEEQEDLIQNHERIIRQLVQAMNSQNGASKPVSQQPPKKGKSGVKFKTPSPQSRPQHQSRQVSPPRQERQVSPERSQSPVQVFEDNEEIEEQKQTVEEYSSEDDSDLDDEIAEELQELQQQVGLKKRS